MASGRDALSSLRLAIASNSLPSPSTSSDASSSEAQTEDLALATHLQFQDPEPHSIPLDSPTRFISSEKPVDLRSIFFAWQKKDVTVPEYIDSAQKLNEKLIQSDTQKDSKVQILVFVERLDLLAWLEGASNESEYVKPIAGDSAGGKAAPLASSISGGATALTSGTGVHRGKQIDPRLQEIYNGERRMGDRNTILRGIKPTVSTMFLGNSFGNLADKPRTSHTCESTRKASSKTARRRPTHQPTWPRQPRRMAQRRASPLATARNPGAVQTQSYYSLLQHRPSSECQM